MIIKNILKILTLMFNLADDFFEKDDKYVFKVRNSCFV